MTSSDSVTVPAPLLGDPAHLAQLLHQVRLGVQATGGVGEHEVDVARRRPLDGVEHDRARIAALAPPDELDAGPLGPRRQLLGGSGPERVAGGEQHAATGGDLLVGDLADARRLADAVDADEQPHVGSPVAVEVQRAIGAGEALLHLLAQGIEQLVGLGDLLRLHRRRAGRRAGRW